MTYTGGSFDKSLWYKAGTSDKVYRVWVFENHYTNPTKFEVHFEFGRRGNTLQKGTKGAFANYGSAESAAQSVINEKMAKGYKEVKSIAAVTSGSSTSPVSALSPSIPAYTVDSTKFPQLLTPVEEEDVENWLSNVDYWMQEKFDGKRIVAQFKIVGKEVIATNKQGKQVLIPSEISAAICSFANEAGITEITVDGELILKTMVYHVFDLLSLNDKNHRELPYEDRYDGLETVFNSIAHLRCGFQKYLKLAKVYINTAEKRAAYAEFKKNKAEGVVFKNHKAVYQSGRNKDAIKCKFWASASCVVKAINAKRSVALVLKETDLSTGRIWVDIGNVSVPVNFDIPKIGDIVEIKYLYVGAKGYFYQPIYLGERDDVSESECTIAQLKYKAKEND